MVKTVTATYGAGLRDWIFQRLSAIYMAFYTLFLFLYVVSHPHLSFAEWHMLFSYTWIKVSTLIFLLSLLIHAWVGMWTIFTDYIHQAVIRSILNVLVLLTLLASFFWGLLIIGSV